MREKFIFVPSTETTHSNLAYLKGDDLKKRDELIKKVIELMGLHTQGAKQKETIAISAMQGSLPSRDNHAVLWQYEKEHLTAAGEDWETAKQALQAYTDTQGRRRIMVTDFLGSFHGTHKDLNRGTAQIEGVLDPAKQTLVKLGTCYLGDARFTDLRPQPNGLLNEVYVLGRIKDGKLQQDVNHTNCHFVWLPNSKTYVRRFVTRGLNHNDIINIQNGRDLGAPVQVINAQRREIRSLKEPALHPKIEGEDLSEQEQILSHTRGWQKRYISTGTSDRPVFSTKGIEFGGPYGAAVIDLAQVDLKTVWDVHSPMAVKNVMGWDANMVVTAMGPGNGTTTFSGEEFLALRDVLRTRELLIKFKVPRRAVVCNPDGWRVLGLGSATGTLGKKAFDGPGRLLDNMQKWNPGWSRVKKSEVLKYVGANSCYWLFLEFADEGNLGWFLKNFQSRYKGTYLSQSLKLMHYAMPTTLPGWK